MKIAIGSANLGTRYGLFGKKKFRIKEILKVEKLLPKSKIEFVDTAHQYKRSEEIIGKTKLKKLNIITKIKLPEQSHLSVNKLVNKIISKSLKRLPSIGGDPDIAQYLQVLPGVVFTGDQGGQLYIRGGAPIHNVVLLDGMILYNAFHSIGLFSVFDTDVIKTADVYTGGFNAEYGGRISSVVDIKTRDGNKKRLAGKVSASTFGSKLLLEGPLF